MDAPSSSPQVTSSHGRGRSTYPWSAASQPTMNGNGKITLSARRLWMNSPGDNASSTAARMPHAAHPDRRAYVHISNSTVAVAHKAVGNRTAASLSGTTVRTAAMA